MKKLFLLLTVAALLAGCRFGNKSNTGGKDRIVCVSKQLTELLFALHQGDKIVGVDLSSTYPVEATQRTTVGYHRLLNAEGIISLDPSVVVHQGDVAPPNVMPQLKQVGIPVKVYPAANSIDSTKILLRLLAKEFGQDTTADRLIGQLDRDLAKADSVVKTYPTKPRVLILHFGRQRDQYFVMGTRGTANEMIKLAGGVNAADTSSFRNLSPEAILKTQPDVILATDFGYDRLGSKEKFADLPGIALTPAYKNGKIYRVEEHDLVYFGPRSGEVIQKFAQIIHQ
ncbi:heme/hemin ABC transporter substrate-binding protein [Flavisolibacter nicotianae]|uniref:heme/hemin ABC transporter substrate-binding protein n=1 Tax=Flavisolibacter nicotianae TaxID=2364882 RepID=UPI000EB077D8|nr:ABC transporter substrate-binding protein [Flavisolibacter nicotianae]